MQLFADLVDELSKVERMFEATEKYFKGSSTPLNDVDCGLQAVSYTHLTLPTIYSV